MSTYHTSVLLQEAINALQIIPGSHYIDGTLGGGGHTKEIINRGGIVLGIDQDDEALEYVKENLKSQISSFTLRLAKGNFGQIEKIARENGFEKVQGILFDLGVSSHQFETSTRGFSFQKNGPLDMRMDSLSSVTAADLVNGLTKPELVELFTKYGEEPFAKRIAEAIIQVRSVRPIQTTTELADILVKSTGTRGAIHPGTRVFQALRIAVNDELNSLKEGLNQAVKLLDRSGRLVVISFQSLEDRMVKNLFEQFQEQGKGNIITNKPIVPEEQEIATNIRARSAKMRIFEKDY